MRSLLLLITAIICMSTSCEKAGDHSCENAICTEIFKMITVHVTTTDGSPVVLDDYYTMRVSTGEKIKPQPSMDNGYFVVLDDSYQKTIPAKHMLQQEFRFVGIKNGKEVINESYMILADCCHIEQKSGKTEIVLQ